MGVTNVFSTALFVLCLSAAEATVIRFGPCVLIYDEPCDSNYVKFFLFTGRGNGTKEYVEITETSDNITSSSYNPQLSSKVIIHGYNSDMNLDYLVNIKNEYLESGHVNVWMIDWSPLAAYPCYPIAAYNVRHAGRCLGQLIKRLGNPEDLHVIGFSLGAHVPSRAARLIFPEKIHRVTGLDPALPLFLSQSIENKLDKTDAQFVDVIHTNSLFQGDISPLGHVDFYANGGSFQPGCFRESNALQCDHHRAPAYFAESINTPVGFWSWACFKIFKPPFVATCAASPPYHLVGEYVNTSLTGVYFFQTADHSPYAQGKTVKTIEYPGGNDIIIYSED